MFDLEQAIATWRRQMLDAGIKFPMPLEELEIHLREEIERQISSGVSEPTAFEAAAHQLGLPMPIKAEFKKAGSFLGRLEEDWQIRINRLFALLWLAYCMEGLFDLAVLVAGLPSNFKPQSDFFPVVLIALMAVRGVVASIRLFGGRLKELRIIRLFAVVWLVFFVINVINYKFSALSFMAVVFMIFNGFSLCLMRSPKTQKQTLA